MGHQGHDLGLGHGLGNRYPTQGGSEISERLADVVAIDFIVPPDRDHDRGPAKRTCDRPSDRPANRGGGTDDRGRKVSGDGDEHGRRDDQDNRQEHFPPFDVAIVVEVRKLLHDGTEFAFGAAHGCQGLSQLADSALRGIEFSLHFPNVAIQGFDDLDKVVELQAQWNHPILHALNLLDQGLGLVTQMLVTIKRNHALRGSQVVQPVVHGEQLYLCRQDRGNQRHARGGPDRRAHDVDIHFGGRLAGKLEQASRLNGYVLPKAGQLRRHGIDITGIAGAELHGRKGRHRNWLPRDMEIRADRLHERRVTHEPGIVQIDLDRAPILITFLLRGCSEAIQQIGSFRHQIVEHVGHHFDDLIQRLVIRKGDFERGVIVALGLFEVAADLVLLGNARIGLRDFLLKHELVMLFQRGFGQLDFRGPLQGPAEITFVD